LICLEQTTATAVSSFKNLLSKTRAKESPDTIQIDATITEGGGEGNGEKSTGNACAKLVIEKGKDRNEESRQGADGRQSEGEIGDKVFLTTLQPPPL
jgi:hypothetical protein